jgi:mannose-1-phosphate guanylyltransferase
MLNGDVLTDIDLTDQLRQHDRTGARATLALTPVEDPSAYGLVRRNADCSVAEFIEKPDPGQADTNLINAGAYILQRDVLDTMPPAGTNVSIEREVFPALVGDGLFGYAASGYWLDIGTPERYLQGTFDILERNVSTEVGRLLADAGGALVDDGEIDGHVVAPAFVGSGCAVAEHAIVGGRAVLGGGVTVREGARVESSVLLDGATIGAHSTVSWSIVGPRVTVGEHCKIDGGVVLGEGAKIGPGNVLGAGARIFPDVELPQGPMNS